MNQKEHLCPKKLGKHYQELIKIIRVNLGKIEFLILSKWTQIVGSFFADHSEPDKISRITEEFNEFDEPIL